MLIILFIFLFPEALRLIISSADKIGRMNQLTDYFD